MNRRENDNRFDWSNLVIIVLMAVVAFGVARGAAGLMLGSGDPTTDERGLSANR